MSLFFKKEKEVFQLIQQYFEVVDEAMKVFQEAMACFFERGPCKEFSEADRHVHALESKADDLRRDIEKRMYSHALLPESRGDILGLLEHFDKMPNLAEVVTFILDTQQVERIPEEYSARFQKLLEVNVEAYHLVRAMVDKLFADPDNVGGAMGPVDKAESESDSLERELIVDVFKSDLQGFQKILLRELIQRIGDLSDSAENVAGRLEIISLKRRL